MSPSAYDRVKAVPLFGVLTRGNRALVNNALLLLAHKSEQASSSAIAG